MISLSFQALELDELAEKCSSCGDSDLYSRIARSASEWKAFADASEHKLAVIRDEWTPAIEAIKKGEKPTGSVQVRLMGLDLGSSSP